VISGMTGIGFTLDGRVMSNSASYPIYKIKEREIKSILRNFNRALIDQLVSLYSTYFQISPEDMRVIIIINNRTTHWVMRSYAYMMRAFIRYSGLITLIEETKLVLNLSGHYYVFEVVNEH